MKFQPVSPEISATIIQITSVIWNMHVTVLWEFITSLFFKSANSAISDTLAKLKASKHFWIHVFSVVDTIWVKFDSQIFLLIIISCCTILCCTNLNYLITCHHNDNQWHLNDTTLVTQGSNKHSYMLLKFLLFEFAYTAAQNFILVVLLEYIKLTAKTSPRLSETSSAVQKTSHDLVGLAG